MTSTASTRWSRVNDGAGRNAFAVGRSGCCRGARRIARVQRVGPSKGRDVFATSRRAWSAPLVLAGLIAGGAERMGVGKNEDRSGSITSVPFSPGGPRPAGRASAERLEEAHERARAREICRVLPDRFLAGPIVVHRVVIEAGHEVLEEFAVVFVREVDAGAAVQVGAGLSIKC